MSSKTNKARVRKFFDQVCNEGKTELIPQIFAKKVCFDGKWRGRNEVRKYLAAINDSFKDPQVIVDRQVAKKNWVSTMRTWRGMQVKEYRGYLPTFKMMEWTEMSVVRLAKEKIVEDWVVRSSLSIV